MARKLIHRIHDTHQYWHLLKSTKAKTNSIFPTPSPFSQRAPIGLYTLCPSKTNHWGWNGEFSWKREACSPFSGHESFIKDATSFQAKPQPSNLQPPGGRKKKKKIFSASDTKDRLLILTASASTMFPNLRSHTVLTGLRTPVLVCRQPHGLVAQKPRLQITSSPHVCLAPAFCCMPQPRLTASLLCLHGVSCQKATASASKKTRSLNDSYPSKQHLRLQAERAFDSMMPDLHLQNLG